MGESWIVSNLNAALSTWNDKLAEIWSLLTESPQTFKGGQVWGVMTGIHSALQAIGYGLLVLFFAVGVMKTCGSFVEVKKPEHALKLFIRFALAKGAVTYGLELMLAVFSIVQGMVSTIITQSGSSGMSSVSLPQELIDAINNVGFWDSIPLWAVTLIGGLLITVLSFTMILTVYGRMFSLWMYAAIAPIPLSTFAGEPTSSVGKNFIRSYAGVPQSPQVLKQLLMCSGYDRYFQIAKCFRDEDLRADRQPEFTQIDMELSFVDVDDVLDVNERLLQKMFALIDVDVPLPIPRMTWQEAMDRFGSDKPDTRFGMELNDVTEVVKNCGFGVFTGAIENGGSVRGINAKGQGAMPRKKIDKLVDFAKDFGAKGLAYLCINEDGSYKSSFAKFMTEEELKNLVEAMAGEPGDLLLFAADKNKVVWDVLGAQRLELARQMNLLELAKQMDLLDKNEFKFLWVTEFPLLEFNEELGRFQAMHHPFTMPMEEDIPYLESDPGRVRAQAYDIVLNGTEIGGGSIRIHQNDIQEKMFEALNFSKEDAYEQFGFLLDAFKYGVPPHAGLAYGLDRLVMLMAKEDSIREVIAFPKVKDASCLMTNAPSPVDAKQLDELGIMVEEKEEQAE